MSAEHSAAAPAEHTHLARWDAVLTELEDNLDAFLDGSSLAEQARTVTSAWQPPLDLGPLPQEYAERALRLAQAQQRAVLHLRRESRAARRQAELLHTAAPARPSVYLDVAG